MPKSIENMKFLSFVVCLPALMYGANLLNFLPSYMVDAPNDRLITTELTAHELKWPGYFPVHPEPTNITEDSIILLKLYVEMQGDSWLIPWDTSASVNTWAGVTLTADGAHVKRLILPDNELSGIIPPEIGAIRTFRRSKLVRE